MKMTVSVGRCLERKAMLVLVKEFINKDFETYKNYIPLSKKNTQM